MKSSPEVRQWLGNLLVAWTFVTGLALVLASAIYHRTGDIKILIAYLGAPFLVGTALFICIAIFGLASRTKARAPEEPVGARMKHERPVTKAALGIGAALERSGPYEEVTLRARPGVDDLAELRRIELEPRHARIAVCALALAAAVGWSEALAPGTLPREAAWAAPATLLGAALGLAMMLRRPRALAKRQAKRETLLESTYRVGPMGVEVTDARGRARVAWREVAAVRETPRLFVLRAGRSSELVIPKAGADPATLDRMRALLRHHAGAHAKLLPQ